jgi:hypothetical protein
MVSWIVSRGISMRDAAEWVGFKIDNLQKFSPSTKKEFKTKVVNSIIKDLDSEWKDNVKNNGFTSLSSSLQNVDRGIYILCFDSGLCVNYTGGKSKVLYIGKGKIRQRIKTHLDNKLFDLFLQIPGIKFKFYMTEPKKPGPNGQEYFHDFEHDLLAEFSKLYAGHDGNKLWPMFNKNAGRQHSNQHQHKAGWKLPLKNTKAGYVWSLSPNTVKATQKFQD